MKRVKGILIFSFISLTFGACEFTNTYHFEARNMGKDTVLMVYQSHLVTDKPTLDTVKLGPNGRSDFLKFSIYEQFQPVKNQFQDTLDILSLYQKDSNNHLTQIINWDYQAKNDHEARYIIRIQNR